MVSRPVTNESRSLPGDSQLICVISRYLRDDSALVIVIVVDVKGHVKVERNPNTPLPVDPGSNMRVISNLRNCAFVENKEVGK